MILRLMMAPMNLAKVMRVRVRIKGDRPLIHSPGPHPQARRKARRRGRTRPRARTKEEDIPVDLGVGDVLISIMDLADGIAARAAVEAVAHVDLPLCMQL